MSREIMKRLVRGFVQVVLIVSVVITTVLASSVAWHIGAAMAQVIMPWLMLG